MTLGPKTPLDNFLGHLLQKTESASIAPILSYLGSKLLPRSNYQIENDIKSLIVAKLGKISYWDQKHL